ncbi:MAG TPA: aldehyde dehydrogenase family protein [Cryomorphaceae bacterium]|nr:aldehyde dehydrogenase family protein [Cryomorphaceae bacterium]
MTQISSVLAGFGFKDQNAGTWIGSRPLISDQFISSFSPVDSQLIGSVSETTQAQYHEVIAAAQAAQVLWREVPAPKRGEAVRVFGNKLREQKEALGMLVSYEMGKSYQEGLGEVQEMIDICDYAVGLSRQLTGLTIKSERPDHFMMEQWHPVGVVGIISAFNFPVAVWAWNAALAWICGDACVWKGSEKVPMCALACQKIWNEVSAELHLPEGLSTIVTGGRDLGVWMAEDGRIPVISATGSIRMGKDVATRVGSRLGRSILELGGNNAMIITDTADLKMTVTAAVFGAVGTAGQRCTSTRRLIIHSSIYDKVCDTIVNAYKQIKIGSPLDAKNHMGPLIDTDAVGMYLQSLEAVEKAGGRFLVKGGALSNQASNCYVSPSIAEVENHWEIVQHETFAPLLYVMKYETVDQAIALQNGVPQGLSSAIMTGSMQEAHRFLSAGGSDCGIANANIGTSGAEIGGAFGGEKETGGGRESGSDAWKGYMRRQTNTLNYGHSLPLAQGIEFNI